MPLLCSGLPTYCGEHRGGRQPSSNNCSPEVIFCLSFSIFVFWGAYLVSFSKLIFVLQTNNFVLLLFSYRNLISLLFKFHHFFKTGNLSQWLSPGQRWSRTSTTPWSHWLSLTSSSSPSSLLTRSVLIWTWRTSCSSCCSRTCGIRWRTSWWTLRPSSWWASPQSAASQSEDHSNTERGNLAIQHLQHFLCWIGWCQWSWSKIKLALLCILSIQRCFKMKTMISETSDTRAPYTQQPSSCPPLSLLSL